MTILVLVKMIQSKNLHHVSFRLQQKFDEHMEQASEGMVEQQHPSEQVQFNWKNILVVETNVPG